MNLTDILAQAGGIVAAAQHRMYGVVGRGRAAGSRANAKQPTAFAAAASAGCFLETTDGLINKGFKI